jgi:hypothetical protein
MATPRDSVSARSHRTRRGRAGIRASCDVFVVDVAVVPWPAPALAVHSDCLVDSDIHAVEWEPALTPRARLLLPGNQQMKFTAALARRKGGMWAKCVQTHRDLIQSGRLERLRVTQHRSLTTR